MRPRIGNSKRFCDVELCSVWPQISCSALDLVNVRVLMPVLRARRGKFVAALREPFDYRSQAVADFNEWIRNDVPAYGRHPPISDLCELAMQPKAAIRQAPAS